MKKFILPLIASLALATPAMANEGRAEVRGGVIWLPGGAQDTYGAAVGYDFDMGEKTFAGVEVSGDKVGLSGTKVAWGFTGRVGVKATESAKIFAAGGYTTEPCDLCEDSFHLGAGAEQNFGKSLYTKIEYRHYFVSNGSSDSDALVAGVGIRF